jgi:hypothetical protein
MASFALVTEGPTDQAVLWNILHGLFDEPIINPIQPTRDATTGETGFGGWELVLECLERGDHWNALQFNDYLIVHLDTDIVQDPRVGVAWTQGETPEALIKRVSARLREVMGEDFIEQYGEQVIFAIAVDTIECWLLPLWASGKKQGKATGCLGELNSALRRKKEKPVGKNYRDYERVSSRLQKRKVLMEGYQSNPSLKVFVEALLRLESAEKSW